MWNKMNIKKKEKRVKDLTKLVWFNEQGYISSDIDSYNKL